MWAFVGQPGQFIAGVPARDLNDDEAEAYGVKDSPLYQPVSEASPKTVAPSENEE